MICFIMIEHESVLKAGEGAASLNDFVYCRVACECTLGVTKVWFKSWYISHHLSKCSGLKVHDLPLICSGVSPK